MTEDKDIEFLEEEEEFCELQRRTVEQEVE